MAIRPLAEPIVETAVAVYERISAELLPTPKKSHYVFNLRDLSKCVQGVLQADSSAYINPMQLMRLFYHESLRIFYDRLINEEDKTYFKQLLQDCCEKFFETTIVQPEETIMFGDFMVFGQAPEDRVYEEIKEMKKLKSILLDYLEDYNGTVGTEMNLVFFADAVEHIVRLARLLRSERGNGLLVGVSGMGKQSLAKLAAHINGYQCHQIALRRGYDHSCFHEDLRRIYWIAGVLNKPTVFLITDTQIVHEAFMEDINNILNSGEVPNLFEGDEYEKIILNTRQPCIESGHPNQTRDGIFEFFIKRVRANLHVIMCMRQLSQQDHYDFGMRAVKSGLVMAGALKRASPDQAEDVTLISALRDSNLPKFLANDAVLFNGILSDLFPGVDLPEPERGELQQAIEQCMIDRNLQPVPELVLKTLQLYETMVVRWGVMLVGPTGSGKTTVLHILANAFEKLHAENAPGPLYRPVRIQTLNPKAISMDELYGFVNLATMEWRDGLLGMAIRSAVIVTGLLFDRFAPLLPFLIKCFAPRRNSPYPRGGPERVATRSWLRPSARPRLFD